MNALLRKEIRDAVRWLPMGLGLLGLLLVYVCRTMYAPQLSNQLYMVTWLSTLLYGAFLSLVTFLPDEREAARAFLIHRAITANQIFRTRIVVGLVVYGLGMLIPLAVLAVYLAAIGPERTPVNPWQTVPAFSVVVAGTIFYFAGIVIACRPAAWYGTRLLPLAAAVGGSFLSAIVMAEAPFYIAIPVYALSCVPVLWMAFAAHHAFVRMPSQVEPTRVRTVSLPMRLVLLSSSILLVGTLGLLPLNFLNQVSYRYPTIEFDKEGIPLYVVRSSVLNQMRSSEALESIPMVDPSEPKPEPREMSDLETTFMFGSLSLSNTFDPTFVQSIGDRQVFFDPSGYLLVYQTNISVGMVLEYVIASDAVSAPNEPRGVPFQSVPRFLVATPFFPQANMSYAVPHPVSVPFQELSLCLVTSEGIKRVDLEKRTIESLLEESFDSISWPLAGDAKWLAIQAGDSLRVYKSDASQPGVPPKHFVLESTLQVVGNVGGTLHYRDRENWTYLDGHARQSHFHVTRCVDGKTLQYTYDLPKETGMSFGRNRSESPFVFGTLPPLLTVGSLAITQTFSDFETIEYLPLIIQLLVTITATVAIARYRGLGARQTVLWVVLAGLLGPGVPLAVLAIYPVAICEICSACQRRRRVENAFCEHCGADWDAMPTEGIEIFERSAVVTLATAGQA